MKVGYVAPISIAAVNGGIRTQALSTIQHIKAFDVQPFLLSPWDDLHALELDLIHVFGASIENVGIADQLYSLGIPFVISPVFYSNRSAKVINRAIKIEKLGAIAGQGIRSDFSVKADLCAKANLVLPNTSDEFRLIEQGFSISPTKIEVVPNGVEDRFAESNPDLFIEKFGIKDFVLFVGQAGAPRKNVRKLLEVASSLDTKLVIIGSFHEDDYGNECKSMAAGSKNVVLIDTLEHHSELLASAYAASKVFVLPSMYETPGIAALEAALAGSNIVITQYGGTKDYFEDHAEYIDPNSTSSILKGLQIALEKKASEELSDNILDTFTWQKVSQKTFDQYKRILK
jgi:glycosyltransferase involved in cell wall biosynthesis